MNRLTYALFLAMTPVMALAQQEAPTFLSVFAASTQYYEYAKDGGGVLGFVTDQKPPGDGTVTFTTCRNKTSKVLLSDLRASKAKCPTKPPVEIEIWSARSNTIGPVFRDPSDTTNTMVLFNGKTVDLTKLQGWTLQRALVPAAKASEPVGFVFTNSDGKPAIAILQPDLKFIRSPS